jgi:hypothetical protein
MTKIFTGVIGSIGLMAAMGSANALPSMGNTNSGVGAAPVMNVDYHRRDWHRHYDHYDHYNHHHRAAVRIGPVSIR